MSRRPLFTTVVTGALSVWSCSVYNSSDLDQGSTFDEGGRTTGGVGHGGSVGVGGSGGTQPFGGTETGGVPTGGTGGKASGGVAGLGNSGGVPSSMSGGVNTGGKSTSGGDVAVGGEGGEGPGAEGGAGASGSGGTTGGTAGKASGGAGTGGVSTGGTATGGGPTYPPELIDDMEDGNQNILLTETRDGAWYTAAGTGGTADPAPMKPFSMAEIAGTPGAPGSTHAFHFVGSAGSEWGVMAAFDFHVPAVTAPVKVPYDASAYKGITFWVKAATPSTSTVVLRIPIKDTTADAGGACKGVTNGCENHFAVPLPVTAAWKQVSFAWADFAQDPSWGYKVASFNKSQLVSVQFVIPIKAGATTPPSADFWIDDIAFIP